MGGGLVLILVDWAFDGHGPWGTWVQRWVLFTIQIFRERIAISQSRITVLLDYTANAPDFLTIDRITLTARDLSAL